MTKNALPPIFQSVTYNMNTFSSKSCTRCETRRISARNPTTRWWRVGTRFSTSNFLLEEGPMCRDLRMQNGNRNSRCVLMWVTTLWRERCRTAGSRFDSRREIVSCVWNDRGERYRWRLWTEIQRRWGLSEGEYRGLETKFEYKYFCWKKLVHLLFPSSFTFSSFSISFLCYSIFIYVHGLPEKMSPQSCRMLKKYVSRLVRDLFFCSSFRRVENFVHFLLRSIPLYQSPLNSLKDDTDGMAI